MLVFHGLTGNGKGFLIWYLRIVFAVLIRTGYLAPVHLPSLIGFTVEHVRVDAADGKPPVIDPAPAVFKKPARSLRIIVYPQCIPGDIEGTVLVTEFGIRGRFECRGIDLPVPAATSRSSRKTWPLNARVQHFAQAVHRNPISLITPESRVMGYQKGHALPA